MNRLKIFFAISLFLMFFSISASVNATIIGGSITGGAALGGGGAFVILTPPLGNPYGLPNSVGNNTFQDPNLYGFNEEQNITITSTLLTDVGITLTSGMTVASHYIFFDPEGSTSVIGTVDFDSEVLAIMTSTVNLANTDFLANTGVNYLNPALRGLELGDSIWISGTNQISLEWVASTPGDYVRVLTDWSPGGETDLSPGGEVPVPEPSTIALMSIGLVGLLGGAAKRKLKKKA